MIVRAHGTGEGPVSLHASRSHRQAYTGCTHEDRLVATFERVVTRLTRGASPLVAAVLGRVERGPACLVTVSKGISAA